MTVYRLFHRFVLQCVVCVKFLRVLTVQRNHDLATLLTVNIANKLDPFLKRVHAHRLSS